jgi:hypothetical protein
MSKRKTFIDLCLKAKILPDEIDDFIDRWHEMPKRIELHDYLGMTVEEYSLWLRVPDALPYIIEARLEQKPLTDAVVHLCRDLRIAAQPGDASKISRLQEWLQANAKSGGRVGEKSAR